MVSCTIVSMRLNSDLQRKPPLSFDVLDKNPYMAMMDLSIWGLELTQSCIVIVVVLHMHPILLVSDLSLMPLATVSEAAPLPNFDHPWVFDAAFIPSIPSHHSP
jgi:hypothetical protein